MLHNETVLTFSEAAARLPRLNGKKVHASSLWRWARRGVGGIHLETRRLGGRFVTSLEALDRFARALAEVPLNGRGSSVPSNGNPRTTPRREKSISAAESTLRKGGIL